MNLDSHSKYDGILVGIGITITLMLTGILVSQTIVLAAGVAGMALVGFALFGVPPTNTPKDLSTRSAYVDTQSDERDHSINT